MNLKFIFESFIFKGKISSRFGWDSINKLKLSKYHNNKNIKKQSQRSRCAYRRGKMIDFCKL
jgi:hypothetical protein